MVPLQCVRVGEIPGNTQHICAGLRPAGSHCVPDRVEVLFGGRARPRSYGPHDYGGLLPSFTVGIDTSEAACVSVSVIAFTEVPGLGPRLLLFMGVCVIEHFGGAN